VSRSLDVLWSAEFLGYDLGDHPLDPVRLELTMALAGELGALAHPNVRMQPPVPAGDALLEAVHRPAYIAATRAASGNPAFRGFGFNTPDNPVFPRMHEVSALVVGASVAAAEAVWAGRCEHAVNVAGGLHHAMADRASGFCVYNDPAVAIARLLELGAQRVAYVDVDVHHGDGVQAAFWDEPRVLTVSLHQSPLSLFPGTGFPEETGGAGAPGGAVNVALPPGTDDAGWLRAFHAVVPGALRAFRPQVLVSQCGCDTHRRDPLADLALTVDGQRLAYAAMHRLAHDLCAGRWVATGGGGYGLVEVVPRAWTHLLAEAAGHPVDPSTPTPPAWRRLARDRRPAVEPPDLMTDGSAARWQPWAPSTDGDPVDRAIAATRTAVYPLLGLDPHDPRD